MKKALVFAGAAEAATGLALLVVPSLVGQLLLGEELTGIAAVVARVAGIALISLGLACWPGPPRVGMLVYSAGVALYLAFSGIAGGAAGILLWPAVALHLILTAALAWESTRDSASIERLVRSFSPMAPHQVSNMLATSRKTAPIGLFALIWSGSVFD